MSSNFELDKAGIDEIVSFLARDFPQMPVEVIRVGDGEARVRHIVTAKDLRPGGTISGPCMMGLADVALYIAILGEIGIVPLAVTTNLNVSFLRKPDGEKNLIADCRLLKLGRTLAVGEVYIYSEGQEDKAVCHVVGTYAIPQSR
ncbi:MAG: PaaI family thioesterase [Alcaligenaceae bacterium]|nr:PaaI family thioesterase [Alcaligenaceae bacterium]